MDPILPWRCIQLPGRAVFQRINKLHSHRAFGVRQINIIREKCFAMYKEFLLPKIFCVGLVTSIMTSQSPYRGVFWSYISFILTVVYLFSCKLTSSGIFARYNSCPDAYFPILKRHKTISRL